MVSQFNISPIHLSLSHFAEQVGLRNLRIDT